MKSPILKTILSIFLVWLSCCATYAQVIPDTDASVDEGSQTYTERIINFHSDISIDTLGRVLVTEHITVYANGNEIKRGIVRRIPVYRKDKNGKKQSVRITIISVMRDGNEEEFKEREENDYKVIYIGNKDRYLPDGRYTYDITYESYGHIGFFDTFDELYWNVTGNEWNFAIEKASASIVLPGNAHYISQSCYTGESGSTDRNCSFKEENSRLLFTAGNLQRGEGLTVAVSFPRDIVKRPVPPTVAELFWQNSRKILGGTLCLAIVGLFYYRTWKKVGRDPQSPAVVPTFRPPHDWSPATVRYCYKKESDDKAFTAALISMAVKKVITIKQNKEGLLFKSNTYQLKAVGDKAVLAKEEKLIYNELFGNRNTIDVDSENHRKFSNASSNLMDSLAESQPRVKTFFHNNYKYALYGLAITVGVGILYSIISKSALGFGFLFLSVFIFIGAGVFIMGLKQKLGCAGLFFMFFGLGFAGGPLFMAFKLLGNDVATGILILLLFIAFGIYVYLIKAPSEEGVKVAAELEGFKLYLATAEEHRLNILTPPEKTPELFEHLLPYAIALDVENEWSDKFNDLLSAVNYNPDWYDGSEPFSNQTFARSLTHSFSSSVSNARVDPSASSSSSSSYSSGSSSWSSGSSGGGSSGGGGGGGGGGGW